MKGQSVTRVRGTNDYLPREEASLRRVEETLCAHFRLFGYQRVQTPVLEEAELFLRKSGEEMASRIYAFSHWDRKLCLRPEMTASVIRAFIDHLQDHPLPIRLQYAGSTFRYEKPQRARFRQFTEVGVECIGAQGPGADAEVLHLAVSALQGAGLRELKLRLGHVGLMLGFLRQMGLGERAQSLLIAFAENLAEGTLGREEAVDRLALLLGASTSLDGMEQERSVEAALQRLGPEEAERFALYLLRSASLAAGPGERQAEDMVRRILFRARRSVPRESLEKAVDMILSLHSLAGPPTDALDALESFLTQNSLDPAPLAELRKTLDLLDVYGSAPPEIVIDLSMARGLRYYTGLVFEIYHPLEGSSIQLAGGGRYDDLVRALGGRESVPACGFSVGLERLRMVLEEVGALPEGCIASQILLAPLAEEDMVGAIALAQEMRRRNIAVELDLRSRGPKSILRYAAGQGIPMVALLGAREREAGVVNLRLMEAHRETPVPLAELPERVQALLSSPEGLVHVS